jgi:hypothetical protein
MYLIIISSLAGNERKKSSSVGKPGPGQSLGVLAAFWSRKEGKFVEGPYQNRSKFMATLCRHFIGEAEREALEVFERHCQDAPQEESPTQIHTQS